MRKILVFALGLMASLAVNAQSLQTPGEVFNEGKWMIGASTSGIGIGYNDYDGDVRADLRLKAGYLFTDDWMVTGNVSYRYQGSSSFQIGGGIRYYVEDNGLYFGLTGNYNYDMEDFVPEFGVGYAYFLSRHITLEPEAYVDYGFSNASFGVGVRLGFSIYF